MYYLRATPSEEAGSRASSCPSLKCSLCHNGLDHSYHSEECKGRLAAPDFGAYAVSPSMQKNAAAGGRGHSLLPSEGQTAGTANRIQPDIVVPLHTTN